MKTSTRRSKVQTQERRHISDHDAELVAAALFGHRDDFVVDLRVEGRETSYLRGLEPGQPTGSPALRATRRVLDIVTASVALVLTAPVFLVVGLFAGLLTKGPVFYAQERVGRNGRIFRCLKFRSMYPDADERLAHLLQTDSVFREQWLRDHKADNDPRITRLGKLLRKTSLDELPQLINVVKGDMSIIGPRPVIPGETVRYGEALPIVLSVRPGITGLWQVSGRNHLPYPERIALDLRYIERQSLLLDAQILSKTVTSVATGYGAG